MSGLISTHKYSFKAKTPDFERLLREAPAGTLAIVVHGPRNTIGFATPEGLKRAALVCEEDCKILPNCNVRINKEGWFLPLYNGPRIAWDATIAKNAHQRAIDFALEIRRRETTLFQFEITQVCSNG